MIHSYRSGHLFWVWGCLYYLQSLKQHRYQGSQCAYPTDMEGHKTQHMTRNPLHNEGHVQQAHDHGIYWSYHIPHHTEATGMTEHWNALLKVQLKYQLGSNSLQGWSTIFQGRSVSIESIWCCVPIGRIHESVNQDMEAGVAPLYHHSQWPTEGLCVSHPYHSGLCRVRGPVPQRRCALPRGTAFFGIICNLLNAEPLILFSLRHKQGITNYTSTAHDWTMFAVQQLHVWDLLYI